MAPKPRFDYIIDIRVFYAYVFRRLNLIFYGVFLRMGALLSDRFRMFAQSNAPALPYVAEYGGYISTFLINSNAAFLVRLANKADQILQDGDPHVPSPKFTAEDVQTIRDGQSILMSHLQEHTPLPENVLDQFRSVHRSLSRISTFFVEKMSVLRRKEEDTTQQREGRAYRLEFLYSSGRHLDLLAAFPNQAELFPAQNGPLQRDFSERSNVISFADAQTRRQNRGELTSDFTAFLHQMHRSADWVKYAAPVSDLDAEIRALRRERDSCSKIHGAIRATAERIVTELLTPPPPNVIFLRPCRSCE